MLQQITSWVSRMLGLGADAPAPFVRKSWDAFATLESSRYDRAIAPEELVNLEQYRKDERMHACGGKDPLRVVAAYAQDSLVYVGALLTETNGPAYALTPPEMRLNKFGQAYKKGAPILLHKHLADLVVDAAIDLHTTNGWTTTVFDGLRTMEGGYLLYRNARDQWLKDGLLAPPGRSAHNRALAVDSMMFDANGREVEMGGHFDHLDMITNHRNYTGHKISETARDNRLTRERAFMRAALKRGTLIAPLREEFWDDRVPGSEKDLWRVMESMCRCTGQKPPAEKAESYAAFSAQWEKLDKRALEQTFGDYALHAPPAENILYHEKLKPIYDRELPLALRQALMDPAKLPEKDGAKSRAA